ncbi:MAG: Hsp20/alpha crystallin family protein [Cyclobacteriaceae bacterium]
MTLVSTPSYSSFSSLFDDFFNTELGDWKRQNYSSTQTTLPKVNVKEDNNGFAVEMAAPGMTKGDFKIELDNNVLTISSEKQEETKKEDVKYARREFSYQSFQRSFALPKSADGEKVSASYDSGILHIAIPKKEEAKPKPAKAISIS